MSHRTPIAGLALFSMVAGCTPTYEGHQLTKPPFAMENPIGRFWIEGAGIPNGEPTENDTQKSLASMKADQWWKFGATIESDALPNVKGKVAAQAKGATVLELADTELLWPKDITRLNFASGAKVIISAVRAGSLKMSLDNEASMNAGGDIQLAAKALGVDASAVHVEVSGELGSKKVSSGKGLIIAQRLVVFDAEESTPVEEPIDLSAPIAKEIAGGYAVRVQPISDTESKNLGAYCVMFVVRTPVIKHGNREEVRSPVCPSPLNDKTLASGNNGWGDVNVAWTIDHNSNSLDMANMELSRVQFHYDLSTGQPRFLKATGSATFRLKRRAFMSASM